jgi:hypothetical protein
MRVHTMSTRCSGSSVAPGGRQRTASVSAAAATYAAPAAARLKALEPGSVLYFAFGSNMDPDVFTGRRGIVPAASVPAVVRTHCLSFGMTGLPYTEPGFATIQQLCPENTLDGLQPQQPCVHGVVHAISAADWVRVQASEGVGSRSTGYQVRTARGGAIARYRHNCIASAHL